ncbi:MAG: SDR family oxidoreductase [Verrucomicrobiota bacterium]
MARLQNKTAIVTGGSSGIGQACALAIAEEGANIVIVSRSQQKIDKTVEAVEALGVKSIGLALNVGNPEDMKKMVEKTIKYFRTVDILIASAGTGGSQTTQRGVPFAFVQLPLEEWEEVIDINLKGVLFSNQAVLPTMIRQGNGHIINVSSSRGAKRGREFVAAYSASKHGVMGITESVAAEMSRYNIKVQAFLPDVVDTPLLQKTKDSVAPYGTLTKEGVGDFVVELLTQPEDVYLKDPLIAPHGGMAAYKY